MIKSIKRNNNSNKYPDWYFLFSGSETRQLGSESGLRAEGQFPLAFCESRGGNVLKVLD